MGEVERTNARNLQYHRPKSIEQPPASKSKEVVRHVFWLIMSYLAESTFSRFI
jgi:hypothetical protein